MDSCRVPSWKAIAVCILKNDMNLSGIGFDGKKTAWCEYLKNEKRERDHPQLRMF
jgi:predicted phosphoadenosine phosphosulfate sulfurtransferase